LNVKRVILYLQVLNRFYCAFLIKIKSMKNRLFGIFLVVAILFSACQQNQELDPAWTSPELKSGQIERSDYPVIPGQYIVVMNEFPGKPAGRSEGYEQGISRARLAVSGLMNEFRIPADKLGFVYAFALEGFSAQLTEDQVIRLLRDKRVKYVEPDQVISLNAAVTQNNATWGLDRVDQRNRPMNGTYTYEATGTGVTAYIIDTGILYGHSEFAGRASSGFDAFGGNGSDCNGHGTHVAGTVGGSVYGVAKNVSLIAVRVLDCSGSGSSSGVIAGMDWVAANAAKPAVANMSLGGGASTAIDAAVERLFKAGVPVIVAAGNGNTAGREQDACSYSPARSPFAYTVGATSNTDAKASYSNYGSCVNLFAPGNSITSAWHTGNTVIATISGTSMATPHVAGAAALYLQSNPTASPQQVYNAITDASTKGIVTSSKTASNHLLYTLGFVSGGGDTTPPSQVTGLSAQAVSNTQINLAWSQATDNSGSIASYKIYRNNSLVATVTSTSYSDSGLTAGTTYNFQVAAVDAAGNEGAKSAQVSATTLSNGGGSTDITLSVRAFKDKGTQKAELTWVTSSTATSYDVYRNNVKIATVTGKTYIDNINAKGGGSYTYKVCEANSTNTCSNEVTVTF
jgi:subtilisin family serine protease